MLILVVTVLALLVVPLLGGRLRRLAELRLVHRWVIVYALGLQVLAISVIPDAPRPVVLGLHASSYVLAAVFVWLNRALPGLPLLALGAGLNALAIAVNGGQMPADPEALARTGIEQDHGGFVNSGVVDDPRLSFLGDVWATPDRLPVLRNVYSFGDLLILLGAVWLVHRTCGTVLGRRPVRELAGVLRQVPPALAEWAPRRRRRTPPVDRTVVVPDHLLRQERPPAPTAAAPPSAAAPSPTAAAR